jgi:hypothetical protein
MKRVCVYSPFWSTFGGGEKYTLAIVKALSQLPGISITLLSTSSLIHKGGLEAFSLFNLGTIDDQVCSTVAKLKVRQSSPVEKLRE